MFNRSALPPASIFYRNNIQNFRARGHKATGLCPFHEDHSPSLSLDLERQLFYCHACGVGGDILRFVMLRDAVDFVTAARSLNAWDESTSTSKPQMARKHAAYKATAARKFEAQAKQQARIRVRDWLHRLERLYRQSNDRLAQLLRGTVTPAYLDEEEVLWGILADSLDLVRIAAAQYARMAGVGDGE